MKCNHLPHGAHLLSGVGRGGQLVAFGYAFGWRSRLRGGCGLNHRLGPAKLGLGGGGGPSGPSQAPTQKGSGGAPAGCAGPRLHPA